MQKINKTTGEINTIQPGGLYSPFPIPAYQVLARAGEHQAQKVLLCLISHLGMNGYLVFPAYPTIAWEAGISQNGIRKALDVLEDFGFIKIFKHREGKKDRNKYYLQAGCWDTSKMNAKASSYMVKPYQCLDCKKQLDRGQFQMAEDGRTAHWGCGGPVTKIELIEKAKQKYRHQIG